MEFKKIVEKFNYDQDFSSFLEKVYLELIQYFGDEELVFEALFNTKIVSVDNVYDYLKDNDLLDEGDFLVNEKALKISAGVCQSVPEITYDAIIGTYHVMNIKRSVAIVNLDLTKTYSKAVLIHELCHLIKSYYNEYEIIGNELISYSGLIECHYELTHDGEKVHKKLIKELGVGLEEGLNTISEEDITRKIVDKDYEASGYGVVNAVAKNLLEIPGVIEVIKRSQLYHDKNIISEVLNMEDFANLEVLSDYLYELNLEMFSRAMQPEKMKETADKIKEILRNEYSPLRDKMTSNLKISQ